MPNLDWCLILRCQKRIGILLAYNSSCSLIILVYHFHRYMLLITPCIPLWENICLDNFGFCGNSNLNNSKSNYVLPKISILQSIYHKNTAFSTTPESAKSRACVLACLACFRDHVLSMLVCLVSLLLAFLECLCARVLTWLSAWCPSLSYFFTFEKLNS